MFLRRSVSSSARLWLLLRYRMAMWLWGVPWVVFLWMLLAMYCASCSSLNMPMMRGLVPMGLLVYRVLGCWLFCLMSELARLTMCWVER